MHAVKGGCTLMCGLMGGGVLGGEVKAGEGVNVGWRAQT